MTPNFKFHFFLKICIKFSESCYFHLLYLKSLLHYANVKYSETLGAFDDTEFRSVRTEVVNSLEQFSLREKGN